MAAEKTSAFAVKVRFLPFLVSLAEANFEPSLTVKVALAVLAN